MEFSMKDALRASVELATSGKNTVLYDDYGNPSVMVIIPKFKKENIDPALGTGVHEAFIVHGREVPEIFYPKYANIIADGGCACSLPGVDPKVEINFDDARSACVKKGKGWHMTSNAEWSAVALWSAKNGTVPRGNNNYGSDIDAPHETGVDAGITYDQGRIARVKTGSGPVTWSHDHTAAGIYDMNGNTWDWISGFKIINGKIYVVGEDGVPMNNFDVMDSENTTGAGWIDTDSVYSVSGNTITVGKTQTSKGSNGNYFDTVAGASGFTVPNWMKSLCLVPHKPCGTKDWYHVNTEGERIPLRGEYWGTQAFAGLFNLNLNNPRSIVSWNVGFRAAYIPV